MRCLPDALAEAQDEYCALYGEDAGRAAYLQEYYCDWAAAVLGSFYAREMASVRAEGRIEEIDALPDQYVHRAWDLGTRNDTSDLVVSGCWCAGVSSSIILRRVVLGLSGLRMRSGSASGKYGWLHGTDFVPHDAKVKEWGSWSDAS